jgi:GT2 family glycosyltransferase
MRFLSTDNTAGAASESSLDRNGFAGKPTVDAIVPYYNESPSALDVTLSGLNSQSFALNQVILVDDGSTVPPDLKSVIEKYHLRTSQIRVEPNAGISAARNFGARQSTAKYLLFVNAEIELCPDWVKNAVFFLEGHPEVGIVFGQIKALRDGWLTEWRLYHLERQETRIDQTCELDWTVGHAMLIAKTQLDILGGWDEQYCRAGEDVDLCSRMRAAGKKVFQVQGAVSSCHSQLGMKQLAAKKIRNSRWNLDIRYKGDPALRPLQFPSAIWNFLSKSRERFQTHLEAKRWHLLVVEVGVLVNGLYLLVAKSLQRHICLGDSPCALWLASLPGRFRRKIGRSILKLQGR